MLSGGETVGEGRGRASVAEARELDWLAELAEASLRLVRPSRAQALAVLHSSDEVLLDVVAAAARVRRAFFGNRVKLNYLVNMKSGFCGEDCSYCSQRSGSRSGVLRYSWLAPEVVADEAERAAARGARRVCLVASGRGPTERDLSRVERTIGAVRARCPELEICVCLGILQEKQGERLKAAGAYAYNHNLNTAEPYYGHICTTHSFADRVGTVRRAAAAGLSPCSGVIVGMGESDEHLVDVAFALRELEPASVPVNFLMPFPGTPLEGCNYLTPARCLRVLAMFRFMFPATEVRIAGGREMHLRSLQPLGLHIANSVFIGDYLTSEGAAAAADLQMIADAGFCAEAPPSGHAAAPAAGRSGASPTGEVEALGLAEKGAHSPGRVPVHEQGEARRSSPAPAGAAGASERPLVPAVRRRGPGTGLPANV